MQKEMMLITSSWNNYKTFRMIPLSNNSTYAEAIFDSENKTLALMSRQSAEQFRMIPRLSEDGEMVKSKVARANGKTYKEERRVVVSSIEYYITEPNEIKQLVSSLAVNSDTFDIEVYLNAVKPISLEKGSALESL